MFVPVGVIVHVQSKPASIMKGDLLHGNSMLFGYQAKATLSYQNNLRAVI